MDTVSFDFDLVAADRDAKVRIGPLAKLETSWHFQGQIDDGRTQAAVGHRFVHKKAVARRGLADSIGRRIAGNQDRRNIPVKLRTQPFDGGNAVLTVS